MRRRTTAPKFWVPTVLSLMAVGGIGIAISAADHADSPATNEGNLDINDLYVFNQGDNVVFIMTVSPLLAPGESTRDARLNPRGLYEFNLDTQRDGVADAVIRVSASGSTKNQKIFVRGPASPTADNTLEVPPVSARFNEIVEQDGMKVWVGPSDDPFYIDLFGPKSVTSVLNGVFSAALETTIGDPTQQQVMFKEVGEDDLMGANVLSIVIELPKQRVADALGITSSGQFFAWATTSEF